MKTYCFNYSIEGVHTFLPMFICIDSTSQFRAWRLAKSYLFFSNKGNKVKVWFKNFPDAVNAKYGTKRVPSDWK